MTCILNKYVYDRRLHPCPRYQIHYVDEKNFYSIWPNLSRRVRDALWVNTVSHSIEMLSFPISFLKERSLSLICEKRPLCSYIQKKKQWKRQWFGRVRGRECTSFWLGRRSTSAYCGNI